MGCQKEVVQMKNHELDAVDRTILNILQRNAKCPLKEIAEKVYLSTPAVSARIEKMEKEGYILGYQAQVNPEALGYHIKALINLEVSPEEKNVFYPFVRKCSNVIECNCVTGEYSMVLEVLFPSTTELDKFIGELQLREYGIQCKEFGPIVPILSTSQNNRDHRKICVVDGKVAFTGGVNLADEYINKKVRFGHWKDTAIKIEGDAVQSFTMMFLQMWNITERQPEDYAKYLTEKQPGFSRKDGYIIPYGDSPFDHENVGEEVYFHILNHAKKYVHIMTPYLILDNEMIDALTRAAKGGIEVQIIMPHIPDKPYAFYLAKTYYEELIAGGVEIYEYTPGFVHAKVFTSDDDTATVGSINLDYRSLYLHFECGVFIYRNPVVRDIEKDFQETLAKCQKVTMTEVRNRSTFVKIYGQVLRIVAPLM